jgi:uncharacterized membrane protein
MGRKSRKKKEAAADGGPAARGRLLPLTELEPEEHARLFRRCGWYVLAGALAFAVVFALLAWLRYRMYYGGRFDLGNMVQAVYNTAHGRFLEITTAGPEPRQMSRLGSHVDPVLAAFALPWLVWPSPVMLLTLQAAIVATGAWPAYRLGARATRDPRAGALLAGALLLYPALGYGVLNEFHAVTLATPLLLWAFLFIEEDRWLAALPFVVAAALCKEEVPLVIAAMGAYFTLRKRSWRPLVLTALAAAYFAVAIWVVIPHFNNGPSPFVDRYAAYGDGAGDIVRTALTDPLRVAGDLLAAGDLEYWAKLLWPLAFVPLLSPLTLLVAAPEFVLNGLSAQIWQRSIEFHYTAAEIPFIFAAAVLGLMRLWRWLGGGFRRPEDEMRGELVSRRDLALLLLLASLAGNYVLGPLPFSLPGAHYSGRAYARSGHAKVLDEAVATIPDGAVVSVNNNVGSHLSARRVVYVFPEFEGAEYVIVDESRPGFYDRISASLHQAVLGKLVLDQRYRSVYARDDVYVFQRVAEGIAPAATPQDQVP